MTDKFQRKHYESVAQALKSARQYAETNDHAEMLDAVIGELAAVFSADNPRFDRERFYSATTEEGKS